MSVAKSQSYFHHPPLFTSESGSNDGDFDIGLLTDYLFDHDDEGRDASPMKRGKNKNIGKEEPNDISDEEDNSSIEGEAGNGKRRKVNGKIKSKDQIDRRRERNRVLARKTRLRKKFFFESLQRQVAQLTAENKVLKDVVRKRLSEDLQKQVLASPGQPVPIVSASAQHATSLLEKADFSLMAAVQAAQKSYCITDPSIDDNPIVYASPGYLELTGYKLEEVLGRNCRFLQGPASDPSLVALLKKGIEDGVDVSVQMINYKADGTQFLNQIFVAPLRDANHRIVNYVGVQAEVRNKFDDEDKSGDATSVLKGKRNRSTQRDTLQHFLIRTNSQSALNKMGAPSAPQENLPQILHHSTSQANLEAATAAAVATAGATSSHTRSTRGPSLRSKAAAASAVIPQQFPMNYIQKLRQEQEQERQMLLHNQQQIQRHQQQNSACIQVVQQDDIDFFGDSDFSVLDHPLEL